MEEKSFISDRRVGEWELLRMLRRDLKNMSVLTREKEIEVARRAKAGDQAAADLLVGSNIRFVIHVVFKYWHPGLPFMDLISEGCEGLMAAAKTFDPERGVRFISYAFPAISHRVYKATGDYYRNRHSSLDEPLDDEGETTPKDLLTADCLGADELTANKQIHRALFALEDRERHIIMLRFWLGLNQNEIAKKIGCSRSRVMQIESDAFRKMRWSMTGNFTVDQQVITPEFAGVI